MSPAAPTLAGARDVPQRGSSLLGAPLRTHVLAVFFLSLCVCVASLLWNRQLGALGGLTDEYFALGA